MQTESLITPLLRSDSPCCSWNRLSRFLLFERIAVLSGFAASSGSVLQLKREELLKWKAAQLERQVTILHAALQVLSCNYNLSSLGWWYQQCFHVSNAA